MKKIISLAILVLSFILTVSCASTPKMKLTKCEPKDNSSVLLCGIFTAEGTGYGKYMGETSVDGLHTKGIELQIKDLDTGKISKTKTMKGGFFYLPKAVAGHKYQFIEATVSDEKNGYKSCITFPLSYLKPTVCKSRQASIMGNYRYTYKKDSQVTYSEAGQEYLVMQSFKMNFPDSTWNNYDFRYSYY